MRCWVLEPSSSSGAFKPRPAKSQGLSFCTITLWQISVWEPWTSRLARLGLGLEICSHQSFVSSSDPGSFRVKQNDSFVPMSLLHYSTACILRSAGIVRNQFWVIPQSLPPKANSNKWAFRNTQRTPDPCNSLYLPHRGRGFTSGASSEPTRIQQVQRARRMRQDGTLARCMNVFAYVYIHIWRCQCIHIYTHLHACMHACMYACMYECTHVGRYVLRYLCIYI